MHMTRPKSSKGRTRPRVTQALAVDEGVHQSCMLPPHPPPPPSPTAFPSNAVPRQSCHQCSDILRETFQRPPDVSVLSLNKYKVLPSIEKRPETVSRLSLSDSSLQREQHIYHLCSQTASKSDTKMGVMSEDQHGPREADNREGQIPGISETETSDKCLLLAIRTPCGQRFKCHFQPTDTLKAVVAAAEAKSGERYKLAMIETMEVPRRTFSDLTMSLSQCGIFTKSVLCISFAEAAMDSD